MISDIINDDLIERLTDNLDCLLDFYKDTMPKVVIFKRRYKLKKGKFKYEIRIRRNLLHELLPNPVFKYRIYKNILNNRGMKI